MEKNLEFRFKGERNYVQGGDIFDAVEAALSAEGLYPFAISFRHFTANQLLLTTTAPRVEYVGEGMGMDGEGNQSPFWLLQTDLPVTARYAFDEASITRDATIEGRTIDAPAKPRFSMIEQIIALTKALNYALVPNVDGKWVFGQLRLSKRLPASAERIRIRQKALIEGRFSTQDIVIDGTSLGDIRFITGKP